MADYQPRTATRGEFNGRARLYPEDVREIRALIKLGVTRADIADQFDVSKSAIEGIASRRCWRWLRDTGDVGAQRMSPAGEIGRDEHEQR